MPINETLMRKLKKEYGAKKGQEVYYGMESKSSPSTSKKAIKQSMKDHPQYYKTKKIVKKK